MERYLGTWYEIAKIPFKWEVGCDFAKATYWWDSINNVMIVKNDCLDKDRNVKYSRTGSAYLPNPEDKTRLRIKFDGLSADPEGSYIILYTDYDNYSIVGGDNKDYLWILSRKPSIPKEDVVMLLDKVRSFGYNPNRLISNRSLIY